MYNKDRQRQYRSRTNNATTKKYEKTKKGFIMRLYRNMQSRINGIQKEKYHLYRGKTLLQRDDFYEWALNHPVFLKLFNEWEGADYNRKLTPSVDRIDSNKGYHLNNMEWVTHSENSSRGAKNNPNKTPVEVWISGKFVGKFDSIQHAADETEIKYTTIYNRATGRVSNRGEIRVIA